MAVAIVSLAGTIYLGFSGVMGAEFFWRSEPADAPVGSVAAERMLEDEQSLGLSRVGLLEPVPAAPRRLLKIADEVLAGLFLQSHQRVVELIDGTLVHVPVLLQSVGRAGLRGAVRQNTEAEAQPHGLWVIAEVPVLRVMSHVAVSQNEVGRHQEGRAHRPTFRLLGAADRPLGPDHCHPPGIGVAEYLGVTQDDFLEAIAILRTEDRFFCLAKCGIAGLFLDGGQKEFPGSPLGFRPLDELRHLIQVGGSHNHDLVQLLVQLEQHETVEAGVLSKRGEKPLLQQAHLRPREPNVRALGHRNLLE